MTNFITKVIKNPLDEVNEKTNLNITFDKIKDGKNVVGFRFNCSEKSEPILITRDMEKEQVEEIKVMNEEAAELEYFKTQYPEEFAYLAYPYEEARRKCHVFGKALQRNWYQIQLSRPSRTC